MRLRKVLAVVLGLTVTLISVTPAEARLVMAILEKQMAKPNGVYQKVEGKVFNLKTQHKAAKANK